MLEIDQQVQKLDESDYLRQTLNEAKENSQINPIKSNLGNMNEKSKNLNSNLSDNSEDDENEDDESLGKPGNFSTVEELIA